MTKTFRDNCDINIVQQKSARLFSRCSNAVKNILFRSFFTPMYASQSWCNFRKLCMQRLRVAYKFGWRTLCNLPWRVSVSIHHVQCNISTFEALTQKYKYCTCCSKGAESLTTYGWVLWCSPIVYNRPYSLNTATAFYFVTDCSDIVVFARSNAFVLYLALTSLGISVLLCSNVVPSVTDERTIVLRMCL